MWNDLVSKERPIVTEESFLPHLNIANKSLLVSVTVSEFIAAQKKGETLKKTRNRVDKMNEHEFGLVNDQLGILSLKERQKLIVTLIYRKKLWSYVTPK